MSKSATPVDQRRAEIALELEYLDARDRFVAAKEARAADPSAHNEKEYRAAKAAFSELRTYWRQIGEAVGTRKPGGADVTNGKEG